MGGILTAAGQLAHASEYRFDYWRTRDEHRFYAVRKGWRKAAAGWAIIDGPAEAGLFGPFWDGREWNHEIRGLDAYRFQLEPALLVAQHLAFEENQRMIDVMERRFPGNFRGSPFDFSWKGTTNE